MHISDTKERLRATVLEVRRQMSFEDVHRLSRLVQERLVASEEFVCAQRVSLYASFMNEVLTDEIFEAGRRAGKELYYPKVLSGTGLLAFYRIEEIGELEPGSYEVPEPAGHGPDITPSGIDLFVVPGVAFDTSGARLGYGKGYFDRTLGGLGSRTAALAYEFQIVPGGIPAEGHDVLMDAIFTEERVIDPKPRQR